VEKPYKSYNGGKESDGTFQKIINILPPHDIYIELFLGNGAIYRNKKPATMASILIDIDTAVIKAWSKIKKGSCSIINTDAISWLENFKVPADIFKKMGTRVLIYIDPPYPMDTRKSAKNLYKHEMNDLDHLKLLSAAAGINANVVISSYPNKIYNETLKDWCTIEFQSQTRSGTATEKVWYNYPTPTVLHDYKFIGNNYRDRERIKGIILRNASKFKRMPPAEVNALIDHLKKENIL